MSTGTDLYAPTSVLSAYGYDSLIPRNYRRFDIEGFLDLSKVRANARDEIGLSGGPVQWDPIFGVTFP